ncbi:hypothetical protein KRX52_15655 [Pseudomonas sp. MAP12]|uniref:Lipoprotein n=1 Tax=Geopseudomonas aromaticivorans TaxID=2849492 RepID=A0ABS6MZI6_9GAMM|nr:hypothetical protein [Pseudomonas aromaticivorans]MBV2134215.1 hypothetical protein [Pseudomonas aromaticivorans]
MSTALRCLPLLALLLLGACQSPSPRALDPVQPAPQTAVPAAPQAQDQPQTLAQQFEAQLAADDLDAASRTFDRLRQQGDGQRLQDYQQLLADAWLQRSQRALEKGDLNAATTALAKARALMPKAPALTNGLGGNVQRKAPAAGSQ